MMHGLESIETKHPDVDGSPIYIEDVIGQICQEKKKSYL